MSSGITRRIDELGRIVIPKELRNELRIKSGDNLEISVSNDIILLKKFSCLKKIKDLSDIYADIIYNNFKKSIIIIDNDIVISASKNIKREILNKKISDKLYSMLLSKNTKTNDIKMDIEIYDDYFINGYLYYNNIILNGDIVGSIIIVSDSILNSEEVNSIDLASKFLSKYLEE